MKAPTTIWRYGKLGMIEIEWEEYLGDEFKAATDDLIDKNEQKIGRKLPEALKELMKTHGGETPMNLVPIYPNGNQMAIDCICHAHLEDKEYNGYTLPFGTTVLADDGYINLVCFGSVGNVFLCLDYGTRDMAPPVVMILRDFVPDDPDHKHFLADNFDEFLRKFTIPIDQVD